MNSRWPSKNLAQLCVPSWQEFEKYLSPLLQPEILPNRHHHLAMEDEDGLGCDFTHVIDAVRPKVLCIGVHFWVEGRCQCGVDCGELRVGVGAGK